ncbi:MAG TPA: DUF309 domain-containing protein [Chloroflexia bacterium]|nr:DUF309 domain-containing protein [Chloroflexia bacterium]
MAVELPPPEFYRAVAEFNRRQYFECHETLEDLWNAERSELRRFYQGILQVGVGFYKIITKPNFRGACSLLESGVNYLRPFEPRQFGVDVAGLIAAAEKARAELLRLGPERLAEFDKKLIPLIEIEPF